mmetsp:Transcript_48467/g.109089  ORF Transcript_48467/g.109089 Transcript_48467/m.109089 type:complete len:135 (+) Transcript_48467:88-492(+)
MRRVEVHVIGAFDLPNMDGPFDKTDAYVRCTMGGKQVFRTKTINNKECPVWDEKHRFEWDGINDLIFSVWDSDTFTADDWIGQYKVNTNAVRAGFKGTVNLTMSPKVRARKQPTLTLKVCGPGKDSCCGGCEVM